jgi:hypothetical protein
LLDSGPIVTPDRHGNELRLVVAHHRDLEPLGPEEQRIGRHHDGWDLLVQLEVDERVGTGQELAARIVDVHLDEQGAGGEVDRVGVPHERALEHPPGKLVERERGGGAGAGGP